MYRDGNIFLRGRVWWLRYSYRGQERRESSGSSDERKARVLLRKRLGAVAANTLGPVHEERVTLNQILDALILDHRQRKLRSINQAICLFNNLRGAFRGGDIPVITIKTADLRNYIAVRQSQGAADATISCELGRLHAAFRLAQSDDRITSTPVFPKLSVQNARQGFAEPGDIERLRPHLPEWLRDPIDFLFLSAWRSHEMKTLKWSDVNLGARETNFFSATSLLKH